MNNASQWRLALAERICQSYIAHPNVKAVMVAGSVAYGWADRYSDIDVEVIWDTVPDASERAALIKQVDGVPESGGDAFYVCGDAHNGVRVDPGHTTPDAVAQILRERRARPAAVRTQQAVMSGLQHVIPLHGAALIAQWRADAADYPDAFAHMVVAHNLKFGPSWELAQLAAQNDLLALRDSLCIGVYYLLRVLMGINRIYDPSFKSLHRHLAAMETAPPNLWPRLQQVMQGEPMTAANTMQALITEMLTLVHKAMPDVDTADVQTSFNQPRKTAIQPAEYATPTIHDNLDFGPRWHWHMLAERADWLFLNTWLCAEFHALINVIAGLNQADVPRYRWMRWRPSIIQFAHFCAGLSIAPDNFHERCTAILQTPLPVALPLLDVLITETFALVAAHCPDIDTADAHAHYMQTRQLWEQMPTDY